MYKENSVYGTITLTEAEFVFGSRTSENLTAYIKQNRSWLR